MARGVGVRTGVKGEKGKGGKAQTNPTRRKEGGVGRMEDSRGKFCKRLAEKRGRESYVLYKEEKKLTRCAGGKTVEKKSTGSSLRPFGTFGFRRAGT